jgi:undecaprenyl-diphosphatase
MRLFNKRYFLLVVFGLLLAIFLWLSYKVYHKETFDFDKGVFLLSRTFENDFTTNLAIVVTFLGSQTFLLPANILLALLFLFIHKKKAYAWKIAVVSLSSSAFLFLVKYLVRRPRPDSPLVSALHYSFPSGHTFTSITFFGMVSFFILTYLRNKAMGYFIVGCCAIMVLLVGWSRIYLYVHYASDVLAGFCLGIMWLILAKWFLLDKKNLNGVDKSDHA